MSTAPYLSLFFELNSSNNFSNTIKLEQAYRLPVSFCQIISSESVLLKVTGLSFPFYSIQGSEILPSNTVLPDNDFFYKLKSDYIQEITVELSDTPPVNIVSIPVTLLFPRRVPLI